MKIRWSSTLGAAALEVGRGGVGHVVAGALEPAHGREVGARVPVVLERDLGLAVGPVERDLGRARGAGDGVGAARLVDVERLAAPVVVRLVGRVGDAVEHVGAAGVVAHDEQHVALVERVVARDADQVDARRPVLGRGDRLGDRPVRAVEQAGDGVADAAGLRADGHVEDRREQARAGAVVVAGAEDLEVDGGAGLDLDPDRLAVVDARRGREGVAVRRAGGRLASRCRRGGSSPARRRWRPCRSRRAASRARSASWRTRRRRRSRGRRSSTWCRWTAPMSVNVAATPGSGGVSGLAISGVVTVVGVVPR